LEDIFNYDETSLYYRMEPSCILATGPVSEIKKAKDRVTVLLTANAAGSERLKPLFIHKYKNLHAIRNINKKKLPVKYFWNKTAWMQRSIWNYYINDLNSMMRRQNCHILLLIDNDSTHAKYRHLLIQNWLDVYEFTYNNQTETIKNCWRKTGILLVELDHNDLPQEDTSLYNEYLDDENE
ncbi:13217_t:CDS:2, partial [Racocetra persica]